MQNSMTRSEIGEIRSPNRQVNCTFRDSATKSSAPCADKVGPGNKHGCKLEAGNFVAPWCEQVHRPTGESSPNCADHYLGVVKTKYSCCTIRTKSACAVVDHTSQHSSCFVRQLQHRGWHGSSCNCKIPGLGGASGFAGVATYAIQLPKAHG